MHQDNFLKSKNFSLNQTKIFFLIKSNNKSFLVSKKGIEVFL